MQEHYLARRDVGAGRAIRIGVYTGKRGNTVRLIRTEYDAYNRRFKLLDSADARKLRDGETYLLMDFGNDASPEHLKDCSEPFRKA